MIKPLSELVEPGQAHVLADTEPITHHMGDFLRAENAAGCPWPSADHNILYVSVTPFDSTKVLIVGQDSYPTPDHPMGLSFYVAPNVHPLLKSLANTYRELISDLRVSMPTNGDLAPWTEYGVMLLNRYLTVGVGWPNSHQDKGRGEATEAVIRALDARTDADSKPQPLVTILQGRNVQDLEPLLTNALIIKSPRPNPLFAPRRFFGSKPFPKVSQALVTMGADLVDWALQADQQSL